MASGKSIHLYTLKLTIPNTHIYNSAQIQLKLLLSSISYPFSPFETLCRSVVTCARVFIARFTCSTLLHIYTYTYARHFSYRQFGCSFIYVFFSLSVQPFLVLSNTKNVLWFGNAHALHLIVGNESNASGKCEANEEPRLYSQRYCMFGAYFGIEYACSNLVKRY